MNIYLKLLLKKPVALFIVLCFLFNLIMITSCSKKKRFIDYVRMLRPGMTKAEVKNLFPKEYFLLEKEYKHNAELNRKFSNSKVKYLAVFGDNEIIGSSDASIYFDKDNVIVGIWYSSSSAPKLKEDDLRFPVQDKKTSDKKPDKAQAEVEPEKKEKKQ